MTAKEETVARTMFVTAYDAEKSGACLDASRAIARIHRERGIPATFFIVGNLLQSEGAAYKELLDEPDLFEIGSHTYSHKLLRDHPVCGPGVTREKIHEEIFRGKEAVENCFERECIGMRPAYGFEGGLSGAPGIVEEVAAAGFRYVSSQVWGPQTTLPAPLAEAYTYEKEGQSHLWEFPAHGWHENVLKGYSASPGRLLLWPPVYPDHSPVRYVKTPTEEFNVHRFFIDKACEEQLKYVSLIWHPFSLGRFDPSMEMLQLCFDHVARAGMPFARFRDLWETRRPQ